MQDFIIEYLKAVTAHLPNARFQFDTYRYEPQSIPDPRISYFVKRQDLESSLPELFRQSQQDGVELSIASPVLFNDQLGNEHRLHMLFVDTTSVALPAIHEVIDVLGGSECVDIVRSGRGYHVYSRQGLLSTAEWHMRLGRLLLCNHIEKGVHVVDDRWIGHRLLGGFGALRLTKNTNHYLREPSPI